MNGVVRRGSGPRTSLPARGTTGTAVRGSALAASLAASLALTLAACSSEAVETPRSDRSPAAGVDTSDAGVQRFAALPVSSIAAAVLSDMAEVDTVTAAVEGTHRGLPVAAQVTVATADGGTDCVGTLDLADGSTEVLRVGEDVYASFDTATLEALDYGPAAAAAIVDAADGRWIRLAPGADLADVQIACHAVVDALSDRLFAAADGGEVEVVGLSELDDQPVLELTRTGSEGTTTAWVGATPGAHRYLRVESPREGQPYVVDRVTYDGGATIPDPSERGVVAAAEVGLGGQG